VVAQTDTENPFKSITPSDVLIKKSFDYTTVSGDFTSPVFRPVWTSINNGAGGITNASPQLLGTGCHGLPFENCGVILAGLNANSTIQATVRYYFERIPATSEPDLLAMAQVPPAFDGVALEIYSRALSTMPVGVPQNENPLGEWFNSVLDSIASIAPKVGNFITNAGNAISQFGNVPSTSSSNATAQRNMTRAQKKQQQKSLPKRQVARDPQNPFNQNKTNKKKKKNRNRKKGG